MKTVSYGYARDTTTGAGVFSVEIADVPVGLWLWAQFWEWLDPCCRRPWRLWAPLVPIAHRAYGIGWDHRIGEIPVSEDWAREHFDWDISEVLDTTEETDDQDSSRV